MRRAVITPISKAPAISVLAAISVTGGMVSTPTRMKLYDAPHSVASATRSAIDLLFEGVFQLGDQIVHALDAHRQA